jgi:hypothetical protein
VYLKTVGQMFLLSMFLLTFRSMSPAGCCPYRSVPLRQADHSFTSTIRWNMAVNAQLNDVNVLEPEPEPNLNLNFNTAASLLLWHRARMPPTTGRSNEVNSHVNNRKRTRAEQTIIAIQHQDLCEKQHQP